MQNLDELPTNEALIAIYFIRTCRSLGRSILAAGRQCLMVVLHTSASAMMHDSCASAGWPLLLFVLFQSFYKLLKRGDRPEARGVLTSNLAAEESSEPRACHKIWHHRNSYLLCRKLTHSCLTGCRTTAE